MTNSLHINKKNRKIAVGKKQFYFNQIQEMKKVILNVAAALSLMFAVSCACDCNKCNNKSEDATAVAKEGECANDAEKACDGAKECCKAASDSAKACENAAQSEEERLKALEANMTEEQLDSLDEAEAVAFKPVATMPSVQLTPDQQKKLKEMIDGARAKAEAIKKLPRAERRAARKALQQECEEFLMGLLDEDQLQAISKKD